MPLSEQYEMLGQCDAYAVGKFVEFGVRIAQRIVPVFSDDCFHRWLVQKYSASFCYPVTSIIRENYANNFNAKYIYY